MLQRPPNNKNNIKTPTTISKKLKISLVGMKNIKPFKIAKELPEKT